MTEEAKTLSNTSMQLGNKTRTQVHGDTSRWVCFCKAWNESEGWMKSTKVLQLSTGCLIQVTTQQGQHVAEALTFVDGLDYEKDMVPHP